MKAEKTIDFTEIDWSRIDKEKAEFIYGEAIARLDSIHKNNDIITNKALSMFSVTLPVLAALTGYLILQGANLSIPILAMSVCSILFLFAILVLLLLILVPKGINSAQGGPAAYFADNFYLYSMTDILKGNIQALYQNINEDSAIQEKRADYFRIAIVLFGSFPIISALVWFVAFLVTKP